MNQAEQSAIVSLSKKVITGKKIVLRDKRLADARDEHTWHADPELAELDAAPQLTISFSQYFLDYASELRFSHSSGRSFAVEAHDGKHIGNIGYYAIDETKGEAELGIMIGDRDYWDKGYGVDAVSTLVDYIFGETNLKRIYLKSLDWNTRAHKCFQRCGFTPCGRRVTDKYNFVLMEINRSQWEQRQKKAEGVSGD